MREINKFKIRIPELGDRPDITVVSDAIDGIADAFSGTIEMCSVAKNGAVLTVKSSRTIERKSLYDGLTLQFVSNFNAKIGEIKQVVIDSIPAQDVVFANDIVSGEFCLLQYRNSRFLGSVVSGKLPDDIMRSGGYIGTAKDLEESIELKLDELEDSDVNGIFSGYSDSNFEAIKDVFDDRYLLSYASVSELVLATELQVGDIVDLQGYYTAGDGAHHKRKIEATDDGSGVQLTNGLWANIVHNGEVNVSWFGTKVTTTEDQSTVIQKAINYSINESCCIDFTMKQEGQFLLSSPIRFSKDTGDTAGVVKFSRHNSFLVDDSKIGDKYAIQFGWPDSSSWQHGRFTGSIIGHCFVRSKSRDNVCNGIYIKGSFISSEFLRADNFNGTGINLDSVHDSSFQKLSVERCGNSDSYAFVASSAQGDTYNCTNISSVQVEQSYDRAISLNMIRSKISNIHCERSSIDVGFSGNTVDIYLTNSEMSQALFHAMSQAKGRIRLNSSVINSLSDELTYEWTCDDGDVSSINSSIMKSLTVVSPANKISFNDCKFNNLTSEKGNYYNCTISDVLTLNTNARTMFVGTSVGELTFSGARTSGRNTFDFCEITKISKICDSEEIFTNCKITELANTSYNAKASFSNCEIVNAILSSQNVFKFLNCNITNWTQSGNSAYLTQNTIILIHNTPWTFPKSAIYPIGTTTQRTDNKGEVVYISDGTTLGWKPISVSVWTTTLDTPYYSTKMQQEGIYEDFISYMDEQLEYERQQRELEEQRQLEFEDREDKEQSYDDWLSTQPQLMPFAEPQPSQTLLDFKKKYLG